MGKLESLKELPTCICLSYFSSGEERKNSRHVILISQGCRDLQSGLTHLCEVVNSSVLLFLPSACICVLQPCNPCNPRILLCLDKLPIPSWAQQSPQGWQKWAVTLRSSLLASGAAQVQDFLSDLPPKQKNDGFEYSSFALQGQYLAHGWSVPPQNGHFSVFTHPQVTKGGKEGKMEREALLAQILTSKTMLDKAPLVSGFPNQGISVASWGQFLPWVLFTAPCSDSVWALLFSFVHGTVGEHFPCSRVPVASPQHTQIHLSAASYKSKPPRGAKPHSLHCCFTLCTHEGSFWTQF